MSVLYIASLQRASGKSTFAAGVISRLQSDGIETDYFKPVDLAAEEMLAEGGNIDLRRLLSLNAQEMTPVVRVTTKGELVPRLSVADQRAKVQAIAEVLAKKGVAVVEGFSSDTQADGLLTDPEILELLDGKVVLILRYDMEEISGAMRAGEERFGERLIGVVINRVPEEEVAKVRSRLESEAGQGKRVLGVLPESSILLGISVRQLAAALGGQILTCVERGGEVVENIMIGAITQNKSVDYYRRKAAKAVVARWDRPDQMLGAVEAAATCLVVTGGQPPLEIIRIRANDAGIPIIQVDDDTKTTVEKVDSLLGIAPFTERRKLEEVRAIMAARVDFEELYKRLELKVAV